MSQESNSTDDLVRALKAQTGPHQEIEDLADKEWEEAVALEPAEPIEVETADYLTSELDSARKALKLALSEENDDTLLQNAKATLSERLNVAIEAAMAEMDFDLLATLGAEHEALDDLPDSFEAAEEPISIFFQQKKLLAQFWELWKAADMDIKDLSLFTQTHNRALSRMIIKEDQPVYRHTVGKIHQALIDRDEPEMQAVIEAVLNLFPEGAQSIKPPNPPKKEES